jgi:sulfur-oxidizing protein SoxY
MQKLVMKPLTRRDVVRLAGVGAFAAVAAGLIPRAAQADAAAVADSMMQLTGTSEPMMGRVTLELPQIAENGNTVPVALSVDSPMTDSDYVKAVHLFADKNPRPDAATFRFTPGSGKAAVATRMRLAKTQNVIAVAEMSDGSVYMAKTEVKVTIGGCGG